MAGFSWTGVMLGTMITLSSMRLWMCKTTVCETQDFVGNHTVFAANVKVLVRNLSVEAPKNDNFFVGFVNKGYITVYGLAQCWESVSGSACEDCLAKAVSNIGSCTPKEEGRVLNAGCYMRYSTQKFFIIRVIWLEDIIMVSFVSFFLLQLILSGFVISFFSSSKQLVLTFSY